MQVPYELGRINVTKAKQAQFLQKDITSVEELTCYFPKRYYDFRTPVPFEALTPGAFSIVRGLVLRKTDGNPNRVTIEDGNGDRMTISFFGSGYQYNRLEKGRFYYFAGKVTESYWDGCTMVNPGLVSEDPHVCRLTPVYSKIKGMSNDYLTGKIQEGISALQANQVFGDRDILARHLKLPERMDAVKALHNPPSIEALRPAAKRVAMDEIYDFYASLQRSAQYASITTGAKTMSRSMMDKFIKAQPFELTPDQKQVIETVVDETLSGKRINAIVSGDVGSGKTMVAASISVFMAENGFQSVILAPTLVLAKQHYADFDKQLTALGFKVALLTGETKKKERTAIMAGLADGSIQILIGTHAILSSDIRFDRVGLTVVDEEHKFGVTQKSKIEEFAKTGAHHLSMTATPIPRSMAMGVYGSNIEVLPIHTMPKGRKPISTSKVDSLDAVCKGILEQIGLGHQAYVVCPFIAESESCPDVWSVEMAEQELRKRLPGVTISSISGDMTGAEVLRQVDAFARRDVQVLVSTTIVEVGVNIPNATLMAVLSADHFGLAALHQLRGRVGRGSDQGYCLLLPDAEADKLDILCRTNDGFEIAEEDLKLRGPGNLLGIEQTGSSRAIDLILKYPRMSANIRRWLSQQIA